MGKIPASNADFASGGMTTMTCGTSMLVTRFDARGDGDK